MLLRKLVVVGLVGFVSFASSAFAEDVVAPNASYAALDGVSFVDQQADVGGGRFNLSIAPSDGPRFQALTPSPTPIPDNRDEMRSYEIALVARATSDIDVTFAHRGSLGFNDQGDVSRRSHGSEVRLGRHIGGPHRSINSSTPVWYLFAASDDEALIWRPGVRNAFGGSSGGGFALQDRIEIGDMQAGITYEYHGIQTSLAYVQRETSVHIGSQSWSRDDDFAGLTVTMRH